MKVNLELQTNNKFKAICNRCESNNVKFGISHVIQNNSWGGSESLMKLTFNCGNCSNSWSEKY